MAAGNTTGRGFVLCQESFNEGCPLSSLEAQEEEMDEGADKRQQQVLPTHETTRKSKQISNRSRFL
jgi:hypothetical protein